MTNNEETPKWYSSRDITVLKMVVFAVFMAFFPFIVMFCRAAQWAHNVRQKYGGNHDE